MTRNQPNTPAALGQRKAKVEAVMVNLSKQLAVSMSVQPEAAPVHTMSLQEPTECLLRCVTNHNEV